MSTLQISLAIIGGLVLALIVAYNAWTSRRNAPKRALPTEAHQGGEPTAGPGAGPNAWHATGPSGGFAADPALRQEPAFDTGMPAPPAASTHHGLERGPDPASHAVDARDALAEPVRPTSAPAPLAHENRLALDPLIDVIAPLLPEHELAGEVALAALPPTRRAGSKPFAIEGLNAATGQWEQPAPGQRYQRFQAGVQLANRMGALNEIEFSEFVVKTQAFADAINATPDFPEMLHEVARARELDQFASEHDAQLAFMLRARAAAWSHGYLQQNAARRGFVPSAMPGRMVLPAGGPGLPPLLSLSYDSRAVQADAPDLSAIRDFALSLDVAQVLRAEQPLTRLREVAAALCQAMDGVLCDQEGQPLPAMAMDAIAADLEQLYGQLDVHELSAGSVLARRLFS